MMRGVVPREISGMFARGMAGLSSPTECVLDDGRVARLERDPSAEVLLRVRLEGGEGPEGFPVTAFRAARQRPGGYPADLPFIRDRPVTLTVGHEQRVLAWQGVADRNALFGEVARQSAADGWEVGPTASGLFGSDARMRKGPSRRTLISMWLPPTVMLNERAD